MTVGLLILIMFPRILVEKDHVSLNWKWYGNINFVHIGDWTCLHTDSQTLNYCHPTIMKWESHCVETIFESGWFQYKELNYVYYMTEQDLKYVQTQRWQNWQNGFTFSCLPFCQPNYPVFLHTVLCNEALSDSQPFNSGHKSFWTLH